jgi:hypothetical protein
MLAGRVITLSDLNYTIDRDDLRDEAGDMVKPCLFSEVNTYNTSTEVVGGDRANHAAI